MREIEHQIKTKNKPKSRDQNKPTYTHSPVKKQPIHNPNNKYKNK